MAEEKSNLIIESDWLNVLVDREEKVTSFKLTKYDLAAAYLDIWVLLLLLMVMRTGIKAEHENGYDFDAYKRPITKTEITAVRCDNSECSESEGMDCEDFGRNVICSHLFSYMFTLILIHAQQTKERRSQLQRGERLKSCDVNLPSSFKWSVELSKKTSKSVVKSPV